MPAYSQNRARIIDFLKQSKTPVCSDDISIYLVGQINPNTVSLARHYLHELWRANKILRTEYGINGKLYYISKEIKGHISIRGQIYKFIPYKEKADSSNIKKLVLNELEKSKAPLTTSQICTLLGGKKYNRIFMKKISFHLADLSKQKIIEKLDRRPIYYSLKKYKSNLPKEIQISISQAVLYTLEDKSAMFSSEIQDKIKNKFNISTNLSNITSTLINLYSQRKITRSATQFNRRGFTSEQAGYIWSSSKASIEKRILQSIPNFAKQWLSKIAKEKVVSLIELGKISRLSPTNNLRYLNKLSAELPKLVSVLAGKYWVDYFAYSPKLSKSELKRGIKNARG